MVAESFAVVDGHVSLLDMSFLRSRNGEPVRSGAFHVHTSTLKRGSMFLDSKAVVRVGDDAVPEEDYATADSFAVGTLALYALMEKAKLDSSTYPFSAGAATPAEFLVHAALPIARALDKGKKEHFVPLLAVLSALTQPYARKEHRMHPAVAYLVLDPSAAGPSKHVEGASPALGQHVTEALRDMERASGGEMAGTAVALSKLLTRIAKEEADVGVLTVAAVFVTHAVMAAGFEDEDCSELLLPAAVGKVVQQAKSMWDSDHLYTAQVGLGSCAALLENKVNLPFGSVDDSQVGAYSPVTLR